MHASLSALLCSGLYNPAMLTAQTHGMPHSLCSIMCTAISLPLPCSVLRNLAMLTARTELVMLGDLDMVVGANLREVVNDEDK
jgi:Glycosyl-transferase for dystroglycan